MQNVYYIDSHFIKEHASQYILSIRYSTDGLSFCVHDPHHKLLVFFYQPYQLDSEDAVIAKVKKIVGEDELLNLKYKKVYLLACHKEKILLPAAAFHPQTLSDMYRICLQPQQHDLLLYRKIEAIDSYLVEALPRHFVNFLNSRYAPLCIVNNAYAFIVHSLASIQFNAHHLFIDIHEKYFDLLLTRNNDILLFNAFDYGSVTDLIYFTLNGLQQCHIDKENVHTTLSGNLVNDPGLLTLVNKYLPNVSILDYAPLSQLVRNPELNNSSFIHLLNIHKCE